MVIIPGLTEEQAKIIGKVASAMKMLDKNTSGLPMLLRGVVNALSKLKTQFKTFDEEDDHFRNIQKTFKSLGLESDVMQRRFGVLGKEWKRFSEAIGTPFRRATHLSNLMVQLDKIFTKTGMNRSEARNWATALVELKKKAIKPLIAGLKELDETIGKTTDKLGEMDVGPAFDKQMRKLDALTVKYQYLQAVRQELIQEASSNEKTVTEAIERADITPPPPPPKGVASIFGIPLTIFWKSMDAYKEAAESAKELSKLTPPQSDPNIFRVGKTKLGEGTGYNEKEIAGILALEAGLGSDQPAKGTTIGPFKAFKGKGLMADYAAPTISPKQALELALAKAEESPSGDLLKQIQSKKLLPMGSIVNKSKEDIEADLMAEILAGFGAELEEAGIQAEGIEGSWGTIASADQALAKEKAYSWQETREIAFQKRQKDKKERMSSINKVLARSDMPLSKGAMRKERFGRFMMGTVAHDTPAGRGYSTRIGSALGRFGETSGITGKIGGFNEGMKKFLDLGGKAKEVGFAGLAGMGVKGAGKLAGAGAKKGGEMLWKGVKHLGKKGVQKTFKAIGEVGKLFKSGATAPFNAFMGMVKGLASAFQPFQIIIEPLTEIMGTLGSIMGAELAPALGDLIKAFINPTTIQMVQDIGKAFLPVIKIFADILGSDAVGLILEQIGNLFETLAPVFGTLLSAVEPFIQMIVDSGLIESLGSIFVSIGGFIASIFSNPGVQQAMSTLMGVLGEVFEVIADIFADPTIQQMVADIVISLTNIVTDVFQILKPILPPIITGLVWVVKGFTWIMEAIVGFVKFITLGFVDMSGDIPSGSNTAGVPVLQRQGVIVKSGLAEVHAGEAVVKKELISEIFKEMTITNNFYGSTDHYTRNDFSNRMKRLWDD